jgi:hypothetical protein
MRIKAIGSARGLTPFTMREISAANFIPATLRGRILIASPACDGTSVPTPNVADDRRLEGGSLVGRPSPGGPVCPLAAKRRQRRGPAGRLGWLKARSSGDPAQLSGTGQEAKACTGNPKSPHAGAGRQPPDREVQRAALKSGSRGGPSKGLLGPQGPRLPSTAPASRRTDASRMSSVRKNGACPLFARHGVRPLARAQRKDRTRSARGLTPRHLRKSRYGARRGPSIVER